MLCHMQKRQKPQLNVIHDTFLFKLTCKELTEEQLVERDRMIQEVKTQLRIEESRLAFIRKMRETQRITPKVDKNLIKFEILKND